MDNGIGMSEDGVKNLFIDFGRLAENENRNRSGTGLGLSICKQIIEKMGGSVDVQSKLGVGSEFSINLKLRCKFRQKPLKNSNPINHVFLKKKANEPEI